jgi:archaellum component FlaD/FlaE
LKEVESSVDKVDDMVPLDKNDDVDEEKDNVENGDEKADGKKDDSDGASTFEVETSSDEESESEGEDENLVPQTYIFLSLMAFILWGPQKNEEKMKSITINDEIVSFIILLQFIIWIARMNSVGALQHATVLTRSFYANFGW